MGILVWIMVGLAVWHFTIFLPDRFWGGIVGASLGAIAGAVVVGVLASGLSIPGNDEMSLVTALVAIPGSMLGIAAVWLIGARQERGQPA
jgi:hypothetical protein